MPSKSKKQHDFMEAADHDPTFAKQAGIAPSVAQEFVKADAEKAATKKRLAHKIRGT